MAKIISISCLLALCCLTVLFLTQETNAQWAYPYYYYGYWGKREAGFGNKDSPKDFRGLMGASDGASGNAVETRL